MFPGHEAKPIVVEIGYSRVRFIPTSLQAIEFIESQQITCPYCNSKSKLTYKEDSFEIDCSVGGVEGSFNGELPLKEIFALSLFFDIDFFSCLSCRKDFTIKLDTLRSTLVVGTDFGKEYYQNEKECQKIQAELEKRLQPQTMARQGIEEHASFEMSHYAPNNQ
uniref:hypothetical protein n=1 Tax=Piscirickettsia salmonis TaxID=1238 RepID=UPI0026B570EC